MTMNIGQEVMNGSIADSIQLPDKRFTLNRDEFKLLIGDVIDILRRMMTATKVYVGAGALSESANLVQSITQSSTKVVVYAYPDGTSISQSNVEVFELDANAPFAKDTFILVQAYTWQLLLLGVPTDTPNELSCIISQDENLISDISHAISVDFVSAVPNRIIQQELTALLLWRVAARFNNITPIASTLGQLAIPMGLAWLLIHRRDNRWQLAERALLSIVKAEKVTIYELDVAQAGLIHRDTEQHPPISLASNNVVARAALANQVITGEEDGLSLAALPALQGEHVWGVVALTTKTPFDDAHIEQLGLLVEIIKLALDEEIPEPQAPKLNAQTESLISEVAEASNAADLIIEEPKVTPPAPSTTRIRPVAEVIPVAAPAPDPHWTIANQQEEDIYWPELDEFEQASSSASVNTTMTNCANG